MLLGFISLLLTVGQGLISRICVSEKVADTWHPCSKQEEEASDEEVEADDDNDRRRRLLAVFLKTGSANPRRFLAAAAEDKCAQVCRNLLLFTSNVILVHKLTSFVGFITTKTLVTRPMPLWIMIN